MDSIGRAMYYTTITITTGFIVMVLCSKSRTFLSQGRWQTLK
jgi:predicted RND superfamily exporter protein